MTLSKRVLNKTLLLWNLGEPKSVKILHGGLQTPKLPVETTKGFFVISRHNLSQKKTLVAKSPKSFLYEIDLLKGLGHLPVPRFLPSAKGTYLEKIEGNWITVDRYIKGKSPRTFTTQMAKELGAFLGEFHGKGKTFRRALPGRRKFYFLPSRVVAKMAPDARRQKDQRLYEVVEEVQRGVEDTSPPQELPKGPIHVDIKPDNELWIKGHLSAVLDFGNFYIDTLMIDVGKTIMWNCRKGKQLDSALVHAFILGYESKRKLSGKERAYLTKSILFAIYSHIWVDLYHVPLGYVPKSYTLSLVKDFLPIARSLR